MDSSRVAVVIEDDQDIRELIEVVLNQSGFDVHVASTGADGVEAVRQHNPAVITLDLGLPDLDGFEVARRVRLFSDSYIIMLTARTDELDTLLGLETGADDYLTKPFKPRELRARVGAMLRRPRLGGAVDSGRGGPAPEGPAVVQAVGPTARAAHNGLSLNGATWTAAVDGTELDLTRTEFELLQAIVESGTLVRSKTDLVRYLRGEERDAGSYISDADERSIEVHMANLRRKLGDDPRAPRWIKTVRGVGYRLAS